MKKVLLFSLGILLCANVAFGQAGAIGLYEDAAYVDCDLADNMAGLKHVYVVHKLTPGATASQWKLVAVGMTCTYLAESSPYIVIGTAFGGISVAYGACRVSDIMLLDISYFCAGATPPCATITVVPDPGAPSGTIEVVDCAATKLIGQGGVMTINGDGTCTCGLPSPTEDTSWGKIKSLYN